MSFKCLSQTGTCRLNICSIDETDTPVGSLNSVITEEEIKTAVRKLKNGKAPGYDNVVNEHISSTLPIFLHVYMKFFILIFDSGQCLYRGESFDYENTIKGVKNLLF